MINRNFLILKEKIAKKHIERFIFRQSSFILMKLKDPVADQLVSYLRKNGIIVLNLSHSYPQLKNRWIRVSAGTKQEMKYLAKKQINFLLRISLNYKCRRKMISLAYRVAH